MKLVLFNVAMDHCREAERDRIDRLEDLENYRYLSGEELRSFLDPFPDWRIADLGSGTGFYTKEIAPVVDAVYAIDIDRALHEFYRNTGMASNVVPITADIANQPFRTGGLDGVVSTRTFHHGLESAIPEVERVLRPGGRLAIVDWSATGAGERGSGSEEKYADLASAQSSLLKAGFHIRRAEERRETFVVTATTP